MSFVDAFCALWRERLSTDMRRVPMSRLHRCFPIEDGKFGNNFRSESDPASEIFSFQFSVVSVSEPVRLETVERLLETTGYILDVRPH